VGSPRAGILNSQRRCLLLQQALIGGQKKPTWT